MPNSSGEIITIKQAIEFITSHNERVKDNPELEFVGVKISGDDIAALKNVGATDYVAFHAVENNRNTVVLMGLDETGGFVKDTKGDIIAIERWDKFGPTVEDVNNDLTKLSDLFN